MNGFLKSRAGRLAIKFILLLAIEAAVFYGGLWALLFALFSGSELLAGVFVLFTLITALSVPIFIFLGKIRRTALKIYMSALAALLIVLTGRAFYMALDARVPVIVEQRVSIEENQPFSDKVPQLPAPASVHIVENIPVMDGAWALYPLYSAFATAIYPEKDYPLYDFLTESGFYQHEVIFQNTIAGFESLLKGNVDIFFMADLSKEQRAMAEELGVELVYTPIGKEAFVFFVNNENTVESLTVEQLQNIYEGKITSWRDLGGGGKITAFQRNEGSGSQSGLERFMKGKNLMTPPTQNVADAMGIIVEMTSDYKNYKGALGFSFRYFLTEMAANEGIRILKINGIAPTEENVASGVYPLTSYFYAITRADNTNPNIQVILEWFLSDEGQYLVKAVGYTPIK
jgi:phosphate transport system substrate-binding protein